MAASEEVPAAPAAGVEDTEENEKDPPLYSLTFNSATSAKSSIAWSYDDRLAVITDSCIYIIVSFSSLCLFTPYCSDFHIHADDFIVHTVGMDMPCNSITKQ